MIPPPPTPVRTVHIIWWYKSGDIASLSEAPIQAQYQLAMDKRCDTANQTPLMANNARAMN